MSRGFDGLLIRIGTNLVEVFMKWNLCLDITHGGCKWKDHLEEYSQAQQRGNLVEDASPRF